MRKGTIVLVGMLMVLGITSCKKDWVCECVETINDDGDVSSQTINVNMNNLKPSEARTECDKLDASNASGTYSYSKECEIKS